MRYASTLENEEVIDRSVKTEDHLPYLENKQCKVISD
jgi:hypothetical protein